MKCRDGACIRQRFSAQRLQHFIQLFTQDVNGVVHLALRFGEWLPHFERYQFAHPVRRGLEIRNCGANQGHAGFQPQGPPSWLRRPSARNDVSDISGLGCLNRACGRASGGIERNQGVRGVHGGLGGHGVRGAHGDRG